MSLFFRKARWILLIGSLGIMAGLTLTSSRWVSSVQAQTMPTPTPTPWRPPEGGAIVLCAIRPPWGAWAVVQWQDPAGLWHDVDNWWRAFDGTDAALRPGWVCTVRWVGRGNYGEGPFRWVIHFGRGGGVWGTSASFYFPTASGQWVWTEMLETSASAVSAIATPSATRGNCSGTHTVQAGENLFRIAYNCGLTVQQLAVFNGIRYPYMIRIGQVLRFP